MALPLKSGADLYNNQALRLRLHNLGADPTEVGAGLIYFNTSSGMNTSKKVRLYTGSAWKTIAFSEDLDVAKNEDFLALQRRVDLLSGDVDTDAIISNMKEVSAFLEGFAEDASLMDYLNTELGKKLDLTGGTLYDSSTDTPLKIRGNDTGAFIAFASLYEYFGYIGAKSDKKPYFYVSGKSYEILTSAGGTIEGALTLLGSGTTYLAFAGTDGTAYGSLGISSTHEPKFWNGSGAYTLLHSGNVGKYALKTDGSNEMKDVLFLNFSNPRIAFKSGDKTHGSFGYFSDGLKWYSSAENAYHTIAFTDSNVASAQALAHSNGTVGATVASSGKVDFSASLSMALNKSILDPSGRSVFMIDGNNSPQIGFDTCGSYSTYINGKDVYLRYGSSRNTGLILNSSGNVTIGASDLAGSDYKLWSSGKTFIDAYPSARPQLGQAPSKGLVVGYADSDGANFGLSTWVESSGTAFMQNMRVNGSDNAAMNIALNPLGGNVGIGTTNPTEKLHVVGDLHVTGNIIADGEVSAGGRAEEGGNAGGGGAAEKITATIEVGLKFKEISHTLGDNVIVQVYEWNANGQTWDMVLTDVETTTNLVTVRFGNETDVPHKVVII